MEWFMETVRARGMVTHDLWFLPHEAAPHLAYCGRVPWLT